MNKDAVAEMSQQYQVEAAQKLVPEGYKQTEVGVIPEDWGAKILSSLLTESPKYGINAAAVPLAGTLPVYIRITDISEDGYFQPTEKVGVDNPFSHLYQLKEGDIVLARTGASVGKSYLYNKADGPLVYAGFLIKIQPDKNKLVSGFLSQFLQTERYWNWVTVNSMRSGQPGINGNEYGGLLVPCPSIKEQAAIANALSNVDALLSELEKLIAKKQAIKTATMQQLLTGRTRLPQFAHHSGGSKKGYKQSELGEIPEDWEVVSLGEFLVNGQLGGNYSNSEIESEYPLIKMGNLNRGRIKLDKIEYSAIKPEEKDRLFYGDVLLNTRNTLELVGKVAIWRDEITKAYFNSNLMRLNFNKHLIGSGFFVNLLMNTDRFLNGLSGIAIGTTSVAAIYLRDLLTLKVVLPSKQEQTAIATILSDMDEEIQALEQRLNKTRQIKQGMMQELLTGKTRLVVPQD